MEQRQTEPSPKDRFTEHTERLYQHIYGESVQIERVSNDPETSKDIDDSPNPKDSEVA